MVGVRDNDPSRGSFSAKAIKLRSFQQDWIDQVDFSGSQDGTGAEFSFDFGVVVLPEKEAGERLIQVASDRHDGG